MRITPRLHMQQHCCMRKLDMDRIPHVAMPDCPVRTLKEACSGRRVHLAQRLRQVEKYLQWQGNP
jgi:hypothetical protein